MKTADEVERTRAAGAEALRGVQALGMYDCEGADEDSDRARTIPCEATFAETEAGYIRIYTTTDGDPDGYLERRDGTRTALDIQTMDEILRILDNAEFPTLYE
jgi:hypothetical protein